MFVNGLYDTDQWEEEHAEEAIIEYEQKDEQSWVLKGGQEQPIVGDEVSIEYSTKVLKRLKELKVEVDYPL